MRATHTINVLRAMHNNTAHDISRGWLKAMVQRTDLVPFDNRMTMVLEGVEVRFLTDTLQEHYLVKPIPTCLPGMLPPQEFEVAAAVELYRDTKAEIDGHTVVDLLLRHTEYLKLLAQLQQRRLQLLGVVSRSRVHKAAMRRIFNAMPEEDPVRDLLKEFIQ